ncbi:PAS domain-containing protein [Mucilaginibacter conchicola]|uniref:PAS domain-containing protein n=1 Tax=Mucilaginibacter conchicola TaxID=2303333 RepID=A0A372NW06_9SPHI|nr:PAS domain-containing protein [Mucilaginibacter conchicola]RFZ92919.1 PAS domain-containing protein [Mucilaginibacter conchicola]
MSDEKRNTDDHVVSKDIELLKKAMDASISGIIITDNNQPDNPIIYCNAAFEQIAGYSRAEIIGHNCRFLQKDDRNQPARAQLRQDIAAGKNSVIEIRNYRKDGTLFWNELNVSPIRNNSGGVDYFIGVRMT